MNIRKLIREETLKILNESQLPPSANSIAKKIINKEKYNDLWIVNQFPEGFDSIVDEILNTVEPLNMLTGTQKKNLSNEILTVVLTTFFNKYKKLIRWDYDEY